jgi:predicted ATPase/transcriptional regulator with XRE-family HTH domain
MSSSANDSALTNFGDLLRHHRIAIGCSQEQLAERAGLSAGGVSALERGVRRRAYADTVDLLAKALELSGTDRIEFHDAAKRARGVAERAAVDHDVPVWEVTNNLPISAKSFVARENDIEVVGRFLGSQARLLTVTGPGGVGKSRLSVEAARRFLPSFADRVWLIEAAQFEDPRPLVHEIGRVIGAGASENVEESVIDRLRPQRALLIIDNCDRFIDAVSSIVGRLLSSCPELRVIATSRERLRISGESAYPLQPLALPDPMNSACDSLESAALRLFVDRAQALDLRVPFTLSNENVGFVEEIVRRTEGLPLAVELAASWLRVLTVEELAAKLRDRFSILVGGNRDAPPRHQTLEALIDWSYESLTAVERDAFGRLTVFPGSFTSKAAAALFDEGDRREFRAIDAVASLLDKSLIAALDRPGRRFVMLESVREFGMRQISIDNRPLRQRHANYFARYATDCDEARKRGDDPDWIAPLQAEHHNFHAALAWSLEDGGDATVGAQLALALTEFYRHDSRSAARSWFGLALKRLTAATAVPLRSELAARLATFSDVPQDAADPTR